MTTSTLRTPAPNRPEPSDVAEYAHEESPSIDRHPAPSHLNTAQPPHAAIAIPSTPASPPDPTYHHHSADPAPARPIPHPSFLLATPPRPQPCPVDWQPRKPKAAPASPSTGAFDPLSMSQRVHNADMGEQQHKRLVLGGCGAVTLYTLLLCIAFAAAVYYLAEGRHPQLGDGAVLTGMLADGSVSASKLSVGAVTNATLSAALYTRLQTLNRSYSASLQGMPTAGAGLWRSQWNPAVLNVRVNGSALSIVDNSLTIAASAINATYIARSAVTSAAIARAAVTAAALQTASVSIASLAPSVTTELAEFNATAAAALADTATAGHAINVRSSVVSVAADGVYLVVGGASKQLTVAAASLDAAVFAVGGIDSASLGADVLAVIPTAGAGLYQPSATSGALSVDVDNSTLVVDGGVLAIGQLSASDLSPGCVDSAHLSAGLNSFLLSVGRSASSAYRQSQTLSLVQSLLQQEMLAVLGLQQPEYERLALLSSPQLLAAMERINDTAFASLGQLNLSAFALSTRLQAEANQLEATLDAAVSQVKAAVPVAGFGLTDVDATLSVAVDGVYLDVANGSVTLAADSIDAAALADGAVTGAKLTAGSVDGAALAAGSVGVDKLSTALSAVLGLFDALGGSTLSLGYANSSTTVTRPDGGDLLLQAADGAGINLLGSPAATNTLSLGSDGAASIVAQAVRVAAGDISLSASAIQSSADELALSTASSSIVLANGSIHATTGASTISSAAVSLLASTNTAITAARVAIAATVRAVPSTLALSGATHTTTIDFANLSASAIRLTGAVSSATLVVNVTGCSAATAGRSVTLLNQLSTPTTLVLPAASCSRYNDLLLPYPASVAVTCAGGQWECVQTERPQGGLALPSSTLTIANNIDNGTVNSTTPVGVVQLSFTPVNNNSPFLRFILASPLLLARPAAALVLTALSSGTTNEDYGTPGRETPVWIVAGQAVNAAAGSVSVTLINVGDPLHTLQTQTVAFVYSIIG